MQLQIRCAIFLIAVIAYMGNGCQKATYPVMYAPICGDTLTYSMPWVIDTHKTLTPYYDINYYHDTAYLSCISSKLARVVYYDEYYTDGSIPLVLVGTITPFSEQDGRWSFYQDNKALLAGYFRSDTLLPKTKLNLLLEEHYQKGQRHGKYCCYDLKGKRIYQTIFKEGTGYAKTFYIIPKAHIRHEGQYKQGKRIGKWIFYNVKGDTMVVNY
ncbi:MAG: hypothetical protein RLZZ628_2316 [Bacteroidota bacterium]|jgi:antitoxin component YwqK of YwqJK toxin-antitoxin module